MNMDWEKLSRGLKELKSGNMVILTDDSDRENEGDLVIAAEFATAEKINFMAKEARGIICLSLTSHHTQKLDIDLQPTRNSSPTSAAFTVSIDAANGISTGVSAADRAKTIAEVLKPDAGPNDIITPGHIFPLLARPNGVLERQGHTEGSIDLMKMAGLQLAAVICEIMNSDGSMARQDDLEIFSKEHNIPILSINDIVRYRYNGGAIQ